MDNKEIKADRLIRANKNNKSKNEVLKIRTLLDTIVLKNNQEDKIQKLLEGNVKK